MEETNLLIMRSAIVIISYICFISCADREDPVTSPKLALAKACVSCGKTPDEMEWFDNLLRLAGTDDALRGDIYVTSIDGNIVFIHQPLIMGCLACVLYDCDGNKIPPEDFDHEKLRVGMTTANRIFRAR